MKHEALAVYPVVDLEHAGAHPEALVRAALRGGATLIQLRDKRGGAGAVERVAARTRAQLAAAGVPLIVNDRLDLAVGLGADGVHLGQRDLAAVDARRLARAAGRADLIIGVSVTTVAQAALALATGADYVSVSPIFDTATKPDIDPPVGLAGLRAIRVAHPEAAIVAIGGIKPARVAEVIAAGADGVAFVSALGGVDGAESSVRAVAAAVAASRSSRPSSARSVP